MHAGIQIQNASLNFCLFQFHMEMMAAMVVLCIMFFSMSLITLELTPKTAIPTKERYVYVTMYYECIVLYMHVYPLMHIHMLLNLIKQAQCKFNKVGVGATEAGIVMIPRGSEEELKAATATAGPVSIAIDGSSNAFRVSVKLMPYCNNGACEYGFKLLNFSHTQFYSSGIFDEPNCSTTELTHAMLVIGYGMYKDKDYWLVKNR